MLGFGNVKEIVASDGRVVPLEWHQSALDKTVYGGNCILAIGLNVTEREAFQNEQAELIN